MRRFFALLLTLGAASPAAAQMMMRPADNSDISALGDEFDAATSLAGWQRFDGAGGWPDMTRRIDVNATAPGSLYLEPFSSGWYAELHAPFVYRTVSGNFDVTARVRVSGLAGDLPQRTWSLAGLMVREARPETPQTWTPRGENWLFITTGVAAEPGVPVFETKTTVNSRSNLKLRPARSGWVELRIVRWGPVFVLLSKYDGEAWQVMERFYRADLPPTVQVGVNAYSDWDSLGELRNDPVRANTTVVRDGRPDLALRVDWIRFRRPPATGGNPLALTDYDFPAARILSMLGDGAS